ncbi:hypothetical protein GCM10010255_83400 [Streptomyces coeruleofuscus]|uniref:ABC transporter permease n=1 Tax=Streptomyces coeruleofuscus TaxID=66879 RepID=A0ABN3JG26_9ACTN
MLPQVASAFEVSVTLMLGALVVTIAVSALVSARILYLGSRRRPHQATGAISVAVLGALPKFLLASFLATMCGVWLGWFPSSGWEGPVRRCRWCCPHSPSVHPGQQGGAGDAVGRAVLGRCFAGGVGSQPDEP